MTQRFPTTVETDEGMTHWHEKHGPISIGAQHGGPESKSLMPITGALVKALKGSLTSSHTTAVDHYALALRISGTHTDFGPERIHRIRRNIKERYISCDIDVSVDAWQRRTPDELRGYLVQRVRTAIEASLSRLRKDGETIDEDTLFKELNQAFGRFMEHEPFENSPPGIASNRP